MTNTSRKGSESPFVWTTPEDRIARDVDALAAQYRKDSDFREALAAFGRDVIDAVCLPLRETLKAARAQDGDPRSVDFPDALEALMNDREYNDRRDAFAQRWKLDNWSVRHDRPSGLERLGGDRNRPSAGARPR
jgi:hypothetical protein